MISPRIIRVLVLVALGQALVIAASTNTQDSVALKALKDLWKNAPDNWVGSDPCGSDWVGIKCNDGRVVSITLASINLIGQLSSDVEGLPELQTLDLSYNKGMTGPLPPAIGNLNKLSSLILVGCGFSGPIPASIGSLSQLRFLSLNSNSFAGPIPASLGNLSNLYWLDLADNRLSGPIPVSKGGVPGLDMLVNTKHFHFGKNQLSGEIPPQLFSTSSSLIHLLLDNNELTGSIPSTLGLVQTLEVVRLDRNALTGPVPKNLNNLTSVQELFLSHNKLSGPTPDLTGLELLNYVDFSNNSFDQSGVPAWFSDLESLTSLIMDNSNIQGQLPVSLFSLPQLQTVKLKNNRINGTLNLGPSFSSQLQLIDLENNFIDSVTHRPGRDVRTILLGNPICDEGVLEDYCRSSQLPNATYSTQPENCTPLPCSSNEVSSPTCTCSYPYTGDLVFRAPSFSNYGNATLYNGLREKLMDTFELHNQPVDSVSLSNPTKDFQDYLVLNLKLFPSGLSYFNQTGISSIGFILSNQTFKPPREFGPFFFRADGYSFNAGFRAGSKKIISTKIIIGASVGAFLLILLLALAVYALRMKKQAESATKKSNPFASWDPNSNSGGVPQLKGARSFSFEEVKRFTNNFSEANDIGAGGYGKVYRGTLPDGRLVAVKRAKQGSSQGSLEFKTEIELLSRVHHRNLVALVGFCFNHDEQMLVYEYITNGTLKEALTGKSGIRLDWMRRLRIALGAAKGLQYLHDLANPRIIHRDVKSSNILLDERLNAKVADFGLSKLLTESEAGHVTTQVKGTMGYLDPEYYMTQQLTEKSDVYSYGIVLLEILTAKSPIERGKYIVREVKAAMDKAKEMYGLREEILDPIVASTMPAVAVERLFDLSLMCVEELGVDRPHMSDVVKEIERIMQLAGLNPNAESASASESYEQSKKDSGHPYNNENLVNYSGFRRSLDDQQSK